MSVLNDVIGLSSTVGICVVLPIVVVWLAMRARINRDNANKEILLAAIQNNPDVDVDKFINRLSKSKSEPKKRLLKEKLLASMVWAIVCMLIGLLMIGAGIYMSDVDVLFFIGGPITAIGVSLIVYFIVGRKMLAREIEAEERQKTQQ